MIFDHCSFSWGRDETFSINSDKKGPLGGITIQNTIFGQGLLPHSAGGLIQASHVTLFRNLYVDNSTRNNKVKGINQYANNIDYNWENGCYIMGDSKGVSNCNIVGNLFIMGPNGGGKVFSRGNDRFFFFGQDNWLDADRNGLFNPKCLDGLGSGGGSTVAQRFDYPRLPLIPALDLPEKLLPTVGASKPRRDPVDVLLVEQVRSFGKAGSLIDDESSLDCGSPGSWRFQFAKAPNDTDRDGMPDAWESAHGTNPKKDDATRTAANGYLNIENYLNSL